MITWIQVILQKHHKVVFTVLLAVIIVAFVFTIGSSVPFFGDRQAQKVERKDVYGYNLQDPATMRFLAIQADTEIRLMQARANQQILEMRAIRYAYLSSIAEKLGIRSLSQDDIVDYMRGLSALKNADGTLNPDAWKVFAASSGMSESQFEQIIMRNAIAAKVEKLIAGPGYALAGEVSEEYKDRYGKWNVEIATLPFDSFNPEIAVDEAKLKEYFNANSEAFRVPAAVALDVAFFPAKPVADTKFTEEEIQAHYVQTTGRYTAFTDSGLTIKELSEVKNEVIEDLKRARGVQGALLVADDIATQIYDANAAYGSDDFKKILANAKVETKQLPLVRPNDTSFPEGVPSDVIKAGFALGSQNYYSDPVLTENGAWLVFFRESKPSFIPEFDGIKENVERMYKHAEKLRLFAEKGKSASDNLKAAVKEGKKFEDAAKAEGFTVASIDKYSFADNAFRNEAMFAYNQVLANTLPKMQAGDVSPMITRSAGGYIVYASAFEAPAVEASKEEMEKYEEQVRQQALGISTYSIISSAIGKAGISE